MCTEIGQLVQTNLRIENARTKWKIRFTFDVVRNAERSYIVDQFFIIKF